MDAMLSSNTSWLCEASSRAIHDRRQQATYTHTMPSTPRSLCLLLNARAAADEQLRAAVQGLRNAGRRVEVRALWEPGQAEQFAAEAVRRDGLDAIIAGGGDGTLNEVVNGVMTGAPDHPPAV